MHSNAWTLFGYQSTASLSCLPLSASYRGCNRVHQALEYLYCPLQSEWHLQELNESKGQDNSSLGHFQWMHQHLVVAQHQIYLRENGSTSQVNEKILDVWDQVPIICGNVVQVAEISTGTPTPVSLEDHCKGEAHGLLEQRTMPSHSMVMNSSLAITILTASRQHAREVHFKRNCNCQMAVSNGVVTEAMTMSKPN